MLHLTLDEGIPKLITAFAQNRLLIQQPTRPMLWDPHWSSNQPPTRLSG